MLDGNKIGIIKAKIKAEGHQPIFDFVHILDKDKEYSLNEYAELIAKNYDINEPKIKQVYDELISNKDKKIVYSIDKGGMWKIELNDEIPEDIDAAKKDKKGLESGPDKTEQRVKNDNPKPKEFSNEELLVEKIELFLSKVSKEDSRRPKYELMLKEIKERAKEKPLKDLNEEGRMEDTAQLNKENLPENSKVKGSYEDEENELKEEIINEAKQIYKKNKNFKEMALSLLDIQRFKHYLESVIGNEFDIEQWIENELIDSETGELRASKDRVKGSDDSMEYELIESDIDAGGNATIDLYYNKDQKTDNYRYIVR